MISQIPCSENTWNAKPGAHLIIECERCPERTSTLGLSGRRGKDECFCSADYYLAPDWTDLRGKQASGECRERCCTCPIGSDCSPGAITLLELPVETGYYRRAADQIDVKRCPDVCHAGARTHA